MKNFLGGLGLIGCALVALVATVALGSVLYFGGLFVQRYVNDIQRENVQHQRGFIQSKIQILSGLITDYNDPAATPGQQTAIVNEFCFQVTLLLPEERPRNIIAFQSSHC